MRPTTKEKHERIHLAFKEWSDKTYKGVRIHSYEYIFLKIAEEFFLSPKTVERILFSKT